MKSILEFSLLKEAEFRRIDLKKTLADVLADLEVLIAEKNATVIVPETFPEIEAVEEQLQQVFLNLLSNSLKFSRQDVNPVIEISYKLKSGEELPKEAIDYMRLSERQLTGEQYLQISIEDNGIGFNEQYASQIFDLFTRLHGKSSSYKGTGIGLSVVKRVSDLHRGWVTAKSTEGKGSTFVLVLPVSK